ncbi:MAG: hypothetical protein NC899_08415, partial [Candidatus Omnitrophica bacterium]|nr:hypothetical protein [Candidatus Omnitrophota bacterium]
EPSEYIIICTPGYDWNSAYVYYSERKGLHIESNELKENKLKNLNRKNYKLLILIDWQNYLNLEEKHKFLNNFEVVEKNEEFMIYKIRF